MENDKVFNIKLDISQMDDGMQSRNILLISSSFKEKDIANCCICGKSIRALEDMKINDEYYCTNCKIDYQKEKSKVDILRSRKRELLFELNQIEHEISQLSNNLRF